MAMEACSISMVISSEPEISGTQLLERAGVSIDVTPYAGIGEAICRIDGEGCPSYKLLLQKLREPCSLLALPRSHRTVTGSCCRRARTREKSITATSMAGRGRRRTAIYRRSRSTRSRRSTGSPWPLRRPRTRPAWHGDHHRRVTPRSTVITTSTCRRGRERKSNHRAR